MAKNKRPVVNLAARARKAKALLAARQAQEEAAQRAARAEAQRAEQEAAEAAAQLASAEAVRRKRMALLPENLACTKADDAEANAAPPAPPAPVSTLGGSGDGSHDGPKADESGRRAASSPVGTDDHGGAAADDQLVDSDTTSQESGDSLWDGDVWCPLQGRLALDIGSPMSTGSCLSSDSSRYSGADGADGATDNAGHHTLRLDCEAIAGWAWQPSGSLQLPSADDWALEPLCDAAAMAENSYGPQYGAAATGGYSGYDSLLAYQPPSEPTPVESAGPALSLTWDDRLTAATDYLQRGLAMLQELKAETATASERRADLQCVDLGRISLKGLVGLLQC